MTSIKEPGHRNVGITGETPAIKPEAPSNPGDGVAVIMPPDAFVLKDAPESKPAFKVPLLFRQKNEPIGSAAADPDFLGIEVLPDPFLQDIPLLTQRFIQLKEDTKKELSGAPPDRQADLAARVQTLESVERSLKELDAFSSDFFDASRFITQIKHALLTGAVDGRNDILREGAMSKATLDRFSKAEEKKKKLAESFQAQYPAITSFAFTLDFTTANPEVAPYLPSNGSTNSGKVLGPYEATFNVLQSLPVVRAYEGLKKSGQLQTAEHMNDVFMDMRRTIFLKQADSHYLTLGSVADIEKWAQDLEALYNDQGLLEMMTAMARAEAEMPAPATDEGVQLRIAAQVHWESLEAYQTLTQHLNDLESGSVGTHSDLQQYETVKTALWGLSDAAREAFGAFIKEAIASDPVKAESWKLRLKALEGERASLQSSDQNTVEALRISITNLQGFQEEILREYLSRETSVLEQVPSTDLSLTAVRKTFQLLDPSSTPRLDQRLQGYQELMTRLDVVALVRTADAQISFTRQQEEIVGQADASLKTILGVSINAASGHRAMIERLGQVKGLAASGRVEEARKIFLALDQSALAAKLPETAKGAGMINMAVAVGIVIGSAVPGGIAGELAALGVMSRVASLGRMARLTVASARLLGNASAFTVSHRILDAAVHRNSKKIYDTSKSAAENVTGLGREVVMNAGMFGALGAANKIFVGAFQKSILGLARRQLVSEGVLKVGEKMGAEGAEAALIAERAGLLQKHMAARMGLVGGAFITELGAFAAWDVVAPTLDSMLQGEFAQGISMLDDAASTALFTEEAWEERISFLVALKVGGALASPVTKPIHEKVNAIVEGRLRPEMEALQKTYLDVAAKWEKGTVPKITLIPEIRKALEAKKALMEAYPSHLRNRASQAAVEGVLKDLRTIEREYKASKSIFETKNPFGLEPVEGTFGAPYVIRVYTYTPRQRAELVKKIKSSGVYEMKESKNGVITLLGPDPSGMNERALIHLVAEPVTMGQKVTDYISRVQVLTDPARRPKRSDKLKAMRDQLGKEARVLLRSGELSLKEIEAMEAANPALYEGTTRRAYSRESLDAMTAYVQRLGGKRVAVFGFGDGVLASSLEKRLGSKNYQVQDSTTLDSKLMDQADVLLVNGDTLTLDGSLALYLHEHPNKTLLVIGATDRLKLSDFNAQATGQRHGPDGYLDPVRPFEPAMVPLQFYYPGVLNHVKGADGKLYKLERSAYKYYSGQDQSYALAFRSARHDAVGLQAMEPMEISSTPSPRYEEKFPESYLAQPFRPTGVPTDLRPTETKETPGEFVPSLSDAQIERATLSWNEAIHILDGEMPAPAPAKVPVPPPAEKVDITLSREQTLRLARSILALAPLNPDFSPKTLDAAKRVLENARAGRGIDGSALAGALQDYFFPATVSFGPRSSPFTALIRPLFLKSKEADSWTVVQVTPHGFLLRDANGKILHVKGVKDMIHPFMSGDKVTLLPDIRGASGPADELPMVFDLPDPEVFFHGTLIQAAEVRATGPLVELDSLLTLSHSIYEPVPGEMAPKKSISYVEHPAFDTSVKRLADYTLILAETMEKKGHTDEARMVRIQLEELLGRHEKHRTEAAKRLLTLPVELQPHVILGDAPADALTSRILKGDATDTLGEYAGTSSQGIGYGGGYGKSKMANQDGLGIFKSRNGGIAAFVLDGVGGNLNGQEATQAALIGMGETVVKAESINLETAFQKGHETVLSAKRYGIIDKGAAAVASGVSIEPLEGKRALAQVASMGDVRVLHLRRDAQGKWQLLSSTADDTQAAETVMDPTSTQEGDYAQRWRTLAFQTRGNPVTHVIGVEGYKVSFKTSDEGGHLRGTGDGLIIDPTSPTGVRRATELNKGLVMEEGDLLLVVSDGFSGNYADFRDPLDQIQGFKTAEDAVKALNEDVHARMRIFQQAAVAINEKARAVESIGISSKKHLIRHEFTYRGRTLFIDSSGFVYDSLQSEKPIDCFKKDNVTIFGYLHQVNHGGLASPPPSAKPSEPGSAPLVPQMPGALRTAPPQRPSGLLKSHGHVPTELHMTETSVEKETSSNPADLMKEVMANAGPRERRKVLEFAVPEIERVSKQTVLKLRSLAEGDVEGAQRIMDDYVLMLEMTKGMLDSEPVHSPLKAIAHDLYNTAMQLPGVITMMGGNLTKKDRRIAWDAIIVRLERALQFKNKTIAGREVLVPPTQRELWDRFGYYLERFPEGAVYWDGSLLVVEGTPIKDPTDDRPFDPTDPVNQRIMGMKRRVDPHPKPGGGTRIYVDYTFENLLTPSSAKGADAPLSSPTPSVGTAIIETSRGNFTDRIGRIVRHWIGGEKAGESKANEDLRRIDSEELQATREDHLQSIADSIEREQQVSVLPPEISSLPDQLRLKKVGGDVAATRVFNHHLIDWFGRFPGVKPRKTFIGSLLQTKKVDFGLHSQVMAHLDESKKFAPEAASMIEVSFDWTKVQTDPETRYVFETYIFTIMPRLETALKGKFKFVEQTRDQTILRFPSPIFLEQAFREIYGERFKDFLYGSGEFNPAFMLAHQEVGHFPVGIFMEGAPFGDNKGVMVPAHFLIMHEFYHVADKLLSPPHVLQVSGTLHRALSSVQGSAMPDQLSSLLLSSILDMEKSERLHTPKDAFFRAWAMAHLYFVGGRDGMVREVEKSSPKWLENHAGAGRETETALDWLITHVFRNQFADGRWGLVHETMEQDMGFTIRKAKAVDLAAYLEFAEATYGALAQQKGPHADMMLKELGALIDAVREEITERTELTDPHQESHPYRNQFFPSGPMRSTR